MKEERIPSQGYEEISCACGLKERAGVLEASRHISQTGHEPVTVRTLIGPATGFEKAWKDKHG